MGIDRYRFAFSWRRAIVSDSLLMSWWPRLGGKSSQRHIEGLCQSDYLRERPHARRLQLRQIHAHQLQSLEHQY